LYCPVQKHAEAMRELFPSSSVTIKWKQLPDVFDLTADIGASKPKCKRKPVRLKPSTIKVFLSHDTMRSVPRGAHHNSLQKKQASSITYCDMPSSKIKSSIIHAFRHHKLSSFYYVKCVGNSLASDDVQDKGW